MNINEKKGRKGGRKEGRQEGRKEGGRKEGEKMPQIRGRKDSIQSDKKPQFDVIDKQI